jgi:hypothetical protein
MYAFRASSKLMYYRSRTQSQLGTLIIHVSNTNLSRAHNFLESTQTLSSLCLIFFWDLIQISVRMVLCGLKCDAEYGYGPTTLYP